MADLNAMAGRFLTKRGVELPASDEEVRLLAYEQAKEEDFLYAHQFRLKKPRQDFTRDDWQEILELSGRERVENNMAAYVACLAHGLL